MNEGSLSQRLDRLEREVRWWRIAASTMLLVVAVLLLMAAGPTRAPEDIRAKKIVVVDEDGKTRIRINAIGGYQR